MTMIEKVARAICKAHTNSEACWGVYRRNAKAAIEAMREPTQKMLEAGETKCFDSSYSEMRDAWQAMIDEALKERQ